MSLIADILMTAGALGAGFYCLVLSRRLNRFTDLDKGVGGAIAVLSMQVDDLTKVLEKARKSAGQSSHRLEELTVRGDEVAQRLELLVASMHDLPDPAELIAATAPAPATGPAEDDASETPLTFTSVQAARAAETPTIFSSKRLGINGEAA